MKKLRFCVFSGTADGRALVDFLKNYPLEITVCTATEYGEEQMEKDGIILRTGRMDESQMVQFFSENSFDLIIDCTHPYAKIVTENIASSAKKCNISHVRMQRSVSQYAGCVLLEGMAEAVKYLEKTTGNILLTTGAKELSVFKDCGYISRVFARVLPFEDSLDMCKAVAIPTANIIAMQGPFSEEFNRALLQMHDIKVMLTKDSGDVGGFAQKISAAKALGVEVVVIKRPEETEGVSLEALKKQLVESYDLKAKQKIFVIGLGVGEENQMTLAVKQALEQSQLIIGAKRLVQNVKNIPVLEEFKAENIANYLEQHPEYQKISVVFSGDIGFYSGAKKLYKTLKNVDFIPLSGLSSSVYLLDKLQMPWQDAVLTSLHGRENNIISSVKKNRKVFTLLGGQVGANELCALLVEYGFGDVVLHIGENLSYQNEKITSGTAKELLNDSFASLSSAVIINENFDDALHVGTADEEFLRTEKIPMTKAEVRAVVMSKLKLTRSAIAYDVGAGTGSVSVEMAQICDKGIVYAIEQKENGCATIEKNKKKFAVSNIEIVHGKAPTAMENLPQPTHVFVGGSSGNLLDIVEKYKKARIVVTAGTLETIAEIVELSKKYKDVEIVQISQAKAKPLANYNFLTANNPIFIASIPPQV